MEKYTLTMRIFHWVLGTLVLSVLTIGLCMKDLPDGDVKWQVYSLHKSLGMIALLIVILRIINRLRSKVPELEGHPYERKFASFTHFVLYILMFVAPFSGYSASSLHNYPVTIFGFVVPNIYSYNPNLATVFKTIHNISTYLLMFFITLHVLGFLKHLIINKRNLLKKII